MIGTFTTISATMPTRDLSSQDSLVMFAERPAGAPQAAKEWYYPGRSIGEQFVYPKEQAMAIAKANNTSVPAFDEGNKVVRIDPTGAVADSDRQAETVTARAEVSTGCRAGTGSTDAAALLRNRRSARPGRARRRSAQCAAPPRENRAAPDRESAWLDSLLSGLSLVGALGCGGFAGR